MPRLERRAYNRQSKFNYVYYPSCWPACILVMADVREKYDTRTDALASHIWKPKIQKTLYEK